VGAVRERGRREYVWGRQRREREKQERKPEKKTSDGGAGKY